MSLQAPASTLAKELVVYLEKQPIGWLNGGATQTAFPPGIKVKVTPTGNLATVDVTGKINKDQERQVLRSCFGRWWAPARAARRWSPSS